MVSTNGDVESAIQRSTVGVVIVGASTETIKGGAGKLTTPRRPHGSIAHDLGVAIVTGHHLPGDILCGEIEFAERMKVSRSVYREAIRILAAKGLVESRRKVGTSVNDRSRWQLLDTDVLAWCFESEPSLDFIRDLFELRLTIEPAAAAMAARRRQDRELKVLAQALDDMLRYGLANERGRAADRLFHSTILVATHNPFMASLSTSVESVVEWTTRYKGKNRKLLRDPMPDHRSVFDAIAEGNAPAAQTAMTELVHCALRDTEMQPKN